MDETNNRRTEKVLVLADSSDNRYDLSITDIGSSIGETRDETGKQPSVFIDVRLKNIGTQPILEAEARCIHGGYWRSLDKSDHSFVADALVDAGATVVVTNYALWPAVT